MFHDAMLHSLVVVYRTHDVGLVVYTHNEMIKNISNQFVEHWSEKEQWCLSNLTLSAKLGVDIIEVWDRSKMISGKKDVCMDMSGARYLKRFPTRLVCNGGIYSWYEESKEENAQLLQKVGLVPHEHCVIEQPDYSWCSTRCNTITTAFCVY